MLEPFREFAYGSSVAAAHVPDPELDPASDAWRMMTELMVERKSSFPGIAASYGLNPGALHALLSLDEQAPKSMSALAEAWRCDASNVTWLVDRLEEKGLAERRPHPTDRRVRTVVLTRKGAKTRAKVHALLHEAPDALRALSPTDLTSLRRILGKIVPSNRPAS
jgi:DNA-binding MarR family transcriptional regulator